MTHVTEDDLDDLEFATLRTGDHTSAARRLSELAASVSGGVSRAKVLLRAGEQWQHAGDHGKAAELYRQAIEDGGETYGDPRAYLADALFELDRPDEARDLIEQIRADAPRDPEVYRTVAEVLYAQGDLAGAYEWATAGADMVLALRERRTGPGDDLVVAEDSLEGLLRLRYRARIDLGRSEDEYDAMLDDLLKAP
ncbi:Tetratricopeptide repeat-containing protein [Thermomonospora echinospora]|uniref:Tetratricopeptide repeat-containing protein n=1 Tax=Thermomonospora echinospora TaxID=1992 RepID=A0A1H6DWT4_9ACTN|nr:tetratricopeptide repeat protein [Thermomonospora echinospora]SEG89731.1 Tetratricopeptide repeat-containing protein [Thermomonospora echinospora]